jgi:uncharacterized membrane protein
MAHCTKCGAAIADNASFCGSCGAAQSAAPSAAPAAGPAPVVAAPAQSQMAENVAGFLCYLVGWITGLIFYFIDKRPYVRFHAAQSIVVFGGLSIIHVALTIFVGATFFMGGFSFASLLFGLVDLVGFVLWILLMIKAYQGERFRVPIAADLAEKIFGKA